jgi:hypothetical protein
MRKAVYAGRSWPILRGMSSVPFSPRSTCRHGRALESKVITQRGSCTSILWVIPHSIGLSGRRIASWGEDR